MRLAKRAVAVVLAAAVVWYVAGVVASGVDDVRRFDWELDPALMAASVVAHVLVLSWGVFVLRQVLRCFGVPARWRDLMRVWSVSTAARYVPGGVWQFAAAAEVGHGRGIPRIAVLAGIAVHLGLTVVGGFLVAAATLPLDRLGLAFLPRWSVLAMLPVAAAAVHPAVIGGALRLLGRVAGRQVLRWEGGWGAGIGLLGLQVVSWTLYGGAYWLFLRALAPMRLADLPAAAGVNALSFISGLVTPLPGGIGVREAAMGTLLRPYFPEAVALAVATLARLWSVAAEIGTLALAFAIPRRRPADPSPGGSLDRSPDAAASTRDEAAGGG
jgi:uncharacterized membrane protein YbhN (UPF0104 family)